MFLKTLTMIVFSLSLPALAKVDPSEKIEYSKVATVNGMVCAFCSNSLEKQFKKEKTVEHVHIDLETHKVSVKFKKGASLPDKELKRMIASSGFEVVSIESPTKKKKTPADAKK